VLLRALDQETLTLHRDVGGLPGPQRSARANRSQRRILSSHVPSVVCDVQLVLRQRERHREVSKPRPTLVLLHELTSHVRTTLHPVRSKLHTEVLKGNDDLARRQTTSDGQRRRKRCGRTLDILRGQAQRVERWRLRCT